MTQLLNYEDFIDRVNELGFMTFSHLLPGFPSLNEETSPQIWHTGDPETDPWCWKDRAAQEKKLAFGCILGGHKGFISARMYPVFYAACHPRKSMEERRMYGEVSQTVWQLWQLFENHFLLDTSDLRHEMGVSKKKGGSRVEAAAKELQQHFYIACAGSRRKQDRFGQPYGWPANMYQKVIQWAPETWMEAESDLSREEARDVILETGTAIAENVAREQLEKVLGFDKD